MPASAGWSRIAALHKSDPQKLTAAAGPTTAAVELAALHLQDAIEGRPVSYTHLTLPTKA